MFLIDGAATTVDSLKQELQDITEDGKLKVDILNEISYELLLSAPQDAQSYATQASALAQSLDYFSGLADAYNLIGASDLVMNQNDKARDSFEKAKAISEEYEYVLGLSKSLNYLGTVAEYRGDLDEAKAYYTATLEHAEEANDPAVIIYSYNGIGRVYGYSGDYAAALEYYLEGLKIAEQNGLEHAIASYSINIANIQGTLGNHQLSEEYTYRALELFQKHGDRNGEGFALTRIGGELKRKEQYEEALEMFKRVLTIREEMNDKRGLSFVYYNLGNTYAKLGDDTKELEYYLKCLTLREELGLKLQATDISLEIGKKYRRIGNYSEALRYINNSLDKAKEKKIFEQLSSGYEALSAVYVDLQNYPQAYESQQLHIQYKDSLLNNEKVKQLTKLQTLYETEKKEKKILELERNKIKLRSQRNYVIGGSIALGLIVLFALQWYKVRKERNDKKEFAEALLFTQEEERKRIARDLHDGIGQSLLLVKRRLDKNTSVTLENQNLISETLEEVRSISQELHPYQIEKFGITSAIEDILQKVESSTDLFISSEIENINELLSEKAEINIYRIIQESLSNIVKHSQATAAKIELKNLTKSITLSIQDNGIGFNYDSAIAESKSLGLKTMFERVSTLGGKLSFTNNQGDGTHINIIIPKLLLT